MSSEAHDGKRIEPEDIRLLRHREANLSDVLLYRNLEKNRHTIEVMMKTWEAIQASLRNPWKHSP